MEFFRYSYIVTFFQGTCFWNILSAEQFLGQNSNTLRDYAAFHWIEYLSMVLVFDNVVEIEGWMIPNGVQKF